MIFDMPMPSLGADMDEAKMVEWKIKEGDAVKKNQVVASVETTKSVIDVESFHEGKILALVAQIGDVIQVGQPILKMETTEVIIPSAPPVSKPKRIADEARIKISPAARKKADENHLDLTLLKGSGSHGEITLKDVEEKLKTHIGVNLREAIAALMAKSKKEIPHYYLERQIQLDSFMNWIEKKNLTLPIEDRILIPAAIMRAIVIALKKFPELNGHYKNEKFIPNSSINLGIAFSIKDGGVMAPAVLEAEKRPLVEFNKAVIDLAQRTRKGGLKNRELSEGTLTVTNVGDLGSDKVFGIIFHPQVALVGMGRIRKVPVVELKNGEEKIHSSFAVDITLSADHRVSDGLLGARYLNEVDKVLNEPTLLE